MDPISWGAIITALVTIFGTVMGWLKYRREKRDRVAQSEVDDLKAQMEHRTVEPDPARRLYLGKPKA